MMRVCPAISLSQNQLATSPRAVLPKGTLSRLYAAAEKIFSSGRISERFTARSILAVISRKPRQSLRTSSAVVSIQRSVPVTLNPGCSNSTISLMGVATTPTSVGCIAINLIFSDTAGSFFNSLKQSTLPETTTKTPHFAAFLMMKERFFKSCSELVEPGLIKVSRALISSILRGIGSVLLTLLKSSMYSYSSPNS